MVRVLGRCASTISRELRRNSAQGHYASVSAQHSCRQRRRRSRPPAKLHIVWLGAAFSAAALVTRANCHEAGVYLPQRPRASRVTRKHLQLNCIYAQPVGELCRELIAWAWGCDPRWRSTLNCS